MGTKTCVMRPATIRPLSQDEIDRKIHSVITEVTALAGDEGPQELGGCEPRWITASELVQRMRPFLVLN